MFNALGMALVLLLAGDDGPPPEADHTAALEEYNQRKMKLHPTADGHWALAAWCEEHGLESLARLHYGQVIRHDPSREAAWKRLGYKKVKGHWATDEQVAAAQAQEAANRVWGPRLGHWHEMSHQPNHRARALEEMAGLDDPAAVPSVWNVFGSHGAADQQIAVQLLGQVTSAASSQLLAVLAVHGQSESVRRSAAETLRGRDPAEAATALIAMMRPLASYEFRPVEKPGRQGELVVTYDGVTVRRAYASPGLPQPTAFINYAGKTGFIGWVFEPEFHNSRKSQLLRVEARHMVDAARRRNEAEWGRAAGAANRQLEADKAELDSINVVIRESNERIAQVLRNATGRDLPGDPAAWKSWLAEQAGRSPEAGSRPSPTYTQYLPLAYVPTYTSMVTVGFG